MRARKVRRIGACRARVRSWDCVARDRSVKVLEMVVRLLAVFVALSGLASVGCGRVGVLYIPTRADAAVAVDAATSNDAGLVADAGLSADAAPSTDGGPSADSGPINDASATDMDAGDEVDAASMPGCRLTVAGTDVVVGVGEQPMLGGTTTLQLAQTGVCAGPMGCGLDYGASVVQQSCDMSNCQKWDVIDAGAGWLAFRNVLSGACLYMANATDGTGAITWECIDADKIRWQLQCAGNDTWSLRNKLSMSALAGDGTSAVGVAIAQSPPASVPEQGWRITPVLGAASALIESAETDANSTWRYVTTTPAAGWTQPAFDDSAWSTGAAAFADATRGFTPMRTSWTTADIWVRRTFSLSSVPGPVVLKIFHDEAAQVYVNGLAVAVPTGWSQGYQSIDLPPAVQAGLHVGVNTLAAHCNNTSGPQFLDLALVSASP